MSRAIDATEVGKHISELIQQVVEQQQPLIIESEGKPQVVMLSIAEYERLLSANRVEVGQTPLGRKLSRIRQQIVAMGEPLLGWDEVNREVADCRGENRQDIA
ncbi:MAG TPA: type II toxin-antitoxin system Phd/YefM family antitoxin [Leptolyngbyaceae cyanobacterium]